LLEGFAGDGSCIDQAIMSARAATSHGPRVPNWANVRKELAEREPSGGDATCAASGRGRAVSGACIRGAGDWSHVERVKKICVLDQPFTVENDEMTVSLKLRRGVILSITPSASTRCIGRGQ